MRRVAVVGSGGAGKSTFARRLGEAAGSRSCISTVCSGSRVTVHGPRDAAQLLGDLGPAR